MELNLIKREGVFLAKVLEYTPLFFALLFRITPAVPVHRG